jgi:hypothetical protein
MDKHYTEEIQLSRDLAKSIEQLDDQYKNVIPHSVWKAYLKLREHYRKEIQANIQ